jgi:hypothetical protein
MDRLRDATYSECEINAHRSRYRACPNWWAIAETLLQTPPRSVGMVLRE